MISVIIVGYNSRRDLETCLPSIFKSTYKKLRVILVDNASSDDSVAFVKKNFPQVEIILNQNSGFPDGANIGIRRALKQKSDYIFLMNPDAMLEENCLEILMKRADQKTILQPLVLMNIAGKNTDLINTTGDYLNFLGFCYCDHYRLHKDSLNERDVVLGSGAAALIPSKVLEETGLLDETFFMYHEDADLFYRIRLFGHNIRLVPNAIAYHKYSFSKNKSKLFYAERNRFLFLYKNFSFKYLVLIFPIIIVNEILMLVYSLLTGWMIKKITAYFSALRLIKKASLKRKINLPHIREQEKKIKHFIGPEISFSEVKSPFFMPYSLVLKIYWALIKPLI